MSARVPEAGDTLLGKYLLHRLLGKGGVGVVYEAEHLRLRQRVALKVLAAEMLAQPQMIERFEREARAMARLSSPHVTRVTDVDATPDGVPFLVMEFLEGNDLQSELKRRGPLPIDEAVHWVRQACLGMAAVHAAGIVHRDLKPANLFLVQGEGGRSLKIMDFGISKVEGEDVEVTSTITTLGTPAYMAPEQVRSAKHIDVRADVWSLGVILYRIVSGKLPFAGQNSSGMAVAIVNDQPEPIGSVRPEVPPALAAVIHRALSKDPAGRPKTVLDLERELATAVGAEPARPSAVVPLLAPVEEPIELQNQPRSGASLVAQSLLTEPPRPRRMWPVAVAAGVVLVLASAGALVASKPSPPPASEGKSLDWNPSASPPATPKSAPIPSASSSVAPSVAARPNTPKPVNKAPPPPSATATATPTPTAKPAASPLPVLL